MCSRALWMVLPCGSSTAFFGVTIIFAFIAQNDFGKTFLSKREISQKETPHQNRLLPLSRQICNTSDSHNYESCKNSSRRVAFVAVRRSCQQSKSAIAT